MTKFLIGKPADQGSRVAKLCAAADVRPAKRPDGASETPLWNDSLGKRIAFGLGKPQNGELLARRGRRSSTAKKLNGKSQLRRYGAIRNRNCETNFRLTGRFLIDTAGSINGYFVGTYQRTTSSCRSPCAKKNGRKTNFSRAEPAYLRGFG
jgi:hypothetical protein